jgi:hypothetical protein
MTLFDLDKRPGALTDQKAEPIALTEYAWVMLGKNKRAGI